MLLLLTTFMACEEMGDTAQGLDPLQQEPVGEDTGGLDTGEPADTDPFEALSAQLVQPSLRVDVLIIGAGASGMAAALEAQAQGADVLLLEMSEAPGGGALYASNFLLVDTVAQRAVGLEDSPEKALSDWARLSPGGDPSDPVVQDYLEGTIELADWFHQELGAQVVGPFGDSDEGQIPRIHNVRVAGEETPGPALVERVANYTWTHHRADALVTVGERVVGAEFTDLRTGETGWIAADATVVATGGFARNLDEVLGQRPDLSGLSLLFEIHPAAIGSGRGLLEQVDAATQNEGHVGVYVHAAEDPRQGMESEAIWLSHLSDTLIVDAEGQRRFSEEEVFSFGMEARLLEAGGQRLWAIYPKMIWEQAYGYIPKYNAPTEEASWTLSLLEYEALGGGARYSSLQEASEAEGISLQTLGETVSRYNSLASSGQDSDMGKPASSLVPVQEEFVMVELKGGLAKCFTGVALDARGQVLGEDGEHIPGLYAAGEVAGMLGVPAVGSGFEGSISAVYWSGRRAGAAAAQDALGL